MIFIFRSYLSLNNDMDEAKLRALISETFKQLMEEPSLSEDSLVEEAPTEEIMEDDKADWTDVKPVKAISRQKDMGTDYFSSGFETKFDDK
jgi:hypothetical protein